MSEKLCVFCKHFYFQNIDTGSGEYPEASGGLGCRKLHYGATGDRRLKPEHWGEMWTTRELLDSMMICLGGPGAPLRHIPDEYWEPVDIQERPRDETEFREILLRAAGCPDYEVGA